MKPFLDLLNNIYQKKRVLLVCIFIASIFFSLIFLSFFRNVGPPQHQAPGTDYQVFYAPAAENISQGKGFTIEDKIVTAIPPGFPVFLSGVFYLSQLTGINKLDLIIIFNIIFAAIYSVLLFFIAELIFDKKIALISALLWMSYPFNLWFIKNPHTEVLFVLLLYAGIGLSIFALKRRHLGFTFLSGIIFGLASLVRYISLFLPFFLVLLAFFFLRNSPKRIRFALPIILLIGSLAVILPWNIYLLSETGYLTQVSTFGKGSFVGGFTFALDTDRVVVSGDVMALMERVRAENLTTGASIFHFLIQELINKPLTLFKLIGIKIFRAWYATSSIWYEGKILAVQILYLLTGLIGIILGIKIFKDKIRDIFFLLGIVFYFWVITVLGLSILRYMVPTMGFIIIFSAITVSIAINALVNKIKD